MTDEAATPTSENPATDDGSGGGSLHPAYVRKLEKQAKDAAKRVQELEGRVADFDKLAARTSRYEELFGTEIDSALEGFSEEARTAVDAALSKLTGADPLDRLEVIRAFKAVAHKSPDARPADVPRGSPPPLARSVEYYRLHPEEMRNAPKEVRNQILRDAGMNPGSNNPWGKR